MKKLVEEVSGEGLESLLGERVTFFGLNYIYSGKLVGVNDAFVKLTEADVIYETGPLNDREWKDAQRLPGDWYVQLGTVESFGLLK